MDVLFDRDLVRLTVLDVLCGDGAYRLLPLPAWEIHEGRIAVESALVFVEGNVGFYRAEGRPFTELAGEPVLEHGAVAGSLADILVTGDGEVRRLVVAGPGGRREVDVGPGLAVGNLPLRPAV
ncbi:MAG TPA: hypothetical protein VK915_06270 [Gaiellaceae bacterium]|nr:hypothetical protein [Gaiellaceae bacterium]